MAFLAVARVVERVAPFHEKLPQPPVLRLFFSVGPLYAWPGAVLMTPRGIRNISPPSLGRMFSGNFGPFPCSGAHPNRRLT